MQKQIIIFIHIFLAFTMGAAGVLYEYILGKLSSDLLGQSDRQWALTIGCMMFAMGIGSYIQQKVADKKVIVTFIISELLLAILGGLSPIILLNIFGNARDFFVLAQVILMLLIGGIIGLEIPIMMRMYEKIFNNLNHKEYSLKKNISRIITADYIGGLIGTIIWLYYILKIEHIQQMAIFVSCLNLFAVIIFVLLINYFKYNNFKQNSNIYKISLGIISVLIIGFSLLYYYTPHFKISLEQPLFRNPIIFNKTTKYQRIVLTKHYQYINDKKSPIINCYINGNLQFSSSDEYIYHESLVHPIFLIIKQLSTSSFPKRILIMGGGDGLAVREILKHPINKIDLVDIDPQMTTLAKTNTYLSNLNQGSLTDTKIQTISLSKRNEQSRQKKQLDVYYPDRTQIPYKTGKSKISVTLYHIDAFLFAHEDIGEYDLIFLDFPDPNHQELSKLYSSEFYKNIKKKLAPNGFLIQQSSSPTLTKEVFLCIGRTLQSAGLEVIPYNVNVPSFGQWGWYLAYNKKTFYPLLSKEKILKEVQKIKISKQLNEKLKYLNTDSLQKLFLFGKSQLFTTQKDINTLYNHKVYQYYIKSL